MEKILLMLSTFNGEKYLSEQLDSILVQNGVDITILIRDDGSTDHTVSILQKYKRKFPDKIIVNLADNIGCSGSFLALMKLAANEYRDFDYYAFSDQDDIWMPDKLEVATTALDTSDDNIKLYYCRPLLVNHDLTPLKSMPKIAKGTLKESFIIQPCIGCSMVFSKELLEKAAMGNPDRIPIHDAWVYKVCLALGGKLISDPTPHILYRQHSSNTVGGVQGFRKKWKRRLAAFIDPNRKRSQQAQLLLHYYLPYLPENEKSILTDISRYRQSFKTKIKIISDKDYSSSHRLHNLMFRVAVLFGKI